MMFIFGMLSLVRNNAFTINGSEKSFLFTICLYYFFPTKIMVTGKPFYQEKFARNFCNVLKQWAIIVLYAKSVAHV